MPVAGTLHAEQQELHELIPSLASACHTHLCGPQPAPRFQIPTVDGMSGCRYEREFNRGQLPLLKRILQHDDSPGGLMVLLVAAVHPVQPRGTTPGPVAAAKVGALAAKSRCMLSTWHWHTHEQEHDHSLHNKTSALHVGIRRRAPLHLNANLNHIRTYHEQPIISTTMNPVCKLKHTSPCLRSWSSRTGGTGSLPCVTNPSPSRWRRGGSL